MPLEVVSFKHISRILEVTDSLGLNREWAEKKYANTPLGLYLDVDFELEKIDVTPSDDWFRLHPEKPVDTHLLMTESALYNNLISQYTMMLRVLKPASMQ